MSDTWTIRAATPLELEWFCRDALGYAPCVDIKGIVSVTAGNCIGAMVAYDHWMPGSCEMHVHVGHRESITRRFIRECINYPFASGRRVIIGRTPGWNYAALDFNKRIGFRERLRIAEAYGKAPEWTRTPINPEHNYALVFQELYPGDAAKWFPKSVIESQYGGVKWLQDLPFIRSSSTKIPPSNLPQILEPSSTPWLRKTRELELDKMMLKAEEKCRRDMAAELYGSAGEISSNTTDLPWDIQKNNS